RAQAETPRALLEEAQPFELAHPPRERIRAVAETRTPARLLGRDSLGEPEPQPPALRQPRPPGRGIEPGERAALGPDGLLVERDRLRVARARVPDLAHRGGTDAHVGPVAPVVEVVRAGA